MEAIEHDDSSSTSSSSSSQTETTERITNHSKRKSGRKSGRKILPFQKKKKSGRKKFKETRHPVYRGVRLRNRSKWVSEVREPGTKHRIWLGTFPNAEMAGRAYDAATLALRGDGSPLNFSDSARLIKRADSCSVSDVKRAAFEAALAFGPRCYESKSSSSPPWCFEVEKGGENMTVDAVQTGFVDEEVVFNMPGFYNSMAEGLVITPPGMKKGFDWSTHDDTDSNMDLTLWKY